MADFFISSQFVFLSFFLSSVAFYLFLVVQNEVKQQKGELISHDIPTTTKELAQTMMSRDSGLVIKPRSYFLTVYPPCFVGQFYFYFFFILFWLFIYFLEQLVKLLIGCLNIQHYVIDRKVLNWVKNQLMKDLFNMLKNHFIFKIEKYGLDLQYVLFRMILKHRTFMGFCIIWRQKIFNQNLCAFL